MKCSKCKKDMKPIPVGSNPPSSEWYCEPCHHSQHMELDTAMEFLRQRAQMQQAARGQ